MNERKIYDAAETKLAAVCNENGLLYRFSRDSTTPTSGMSRSS